MDQVERCVRQAERLCKKRNYEITGGGKETKRYGGSTGEQSVAEQHTLIVRCDGEPAAAEPSSEALPEPHAEQAPETQPTQSAPLDVPTRAPANTGKSEQVCAPGATQRCVGPGACEGGQSCNANGSGYLPCDCGEASAREPAGAGSSSAGEAH